MTRQPARSSLLIALLSVAVGAQVAACSSGRKARRADRNSRVTGGDTSTRAAASNAPEWARTGKSKRHPSRAFIVGVGQGGEKEIAGSNARAELGKQIQVSVQNTLKSKEWETASNGVVDAGTFVENYGVETVNLSLEGVEIVERYEEGGTHYAMAVLNKGDAAARLEAKIADSRSQIDAFKAEAQSAQASGQIASALKSWIKAHDMVLRVLADAAVLRILIGKRLTDLPVAEIQRAIEEMMAAIAIEKQAGDSQKAEVGKPLPHPLVTRVTYNGGGRAVGVPGLTLRFEVPSGAGEVEPMGRTSPDGTVEVKVHKVGRTKDVQNRVTTTVDWEVFLGDVSAAAKATWTPRFKALSATYTYEVKTVATTKIAVRVLEYVDDKLVRSEQLGAAISKALLKAGFDVTDSRALTALGGRELADATPAKLQSVMGNGADVVVVGEVRSEFSSKVGARMTFYRARAQLRAVNIHSGQIMAEETDEKKGAGNSPERAGKKALQTLAKKSKLPTQFARLVADGLR